jgi:hypothetical protein
MRRAGLIASVAALALAGAGCGDPPEDTAHSDGKAVGAALAQLSRSESPQELTAATRALRDAVGGVSDDVGDRVRAQVGAQRDELDAAVADLRTAITSTDRAAQGRARTSLQGDIQDLRARAAAFARSDDSVANSFWDGVRDGFDDHG